MDVCLQASSLECFVGNLLSLSERVAFERHLSHCSGCTHAVAAMLQALPKTVSIYGHETSSRATFTPSVEGYELLSVIAVGGMGVVYKAQKQNTGTPVALKTIAAQTQAAVAALRREGNVLRGLSHPGIVRILEQGTTLEGAPYFVMKLVRGRRLSELFARVPLAERASNTRVLSVLRRLCSTLAAMHSKGVVHRDVNPRNVLVRGLQPVLVDFGLAARIADSQSRESIDIAGATMGTLAYAAPEQLRGEFVDPRADLYSIGCMLFECLTGRLPFEHATQAAQIHAHLHEPPRPPSDFAAVPAELDQLTLRLLAKRPRERIGYARDVADVLGRFAGRDWAGGRRLQRQHYLYRSALIGRKRWLAEAQDTLEQCVAGRGGRIIVSGESGAGKTRFLSEVATLAVRMGMSVVPAECAAMSGDASSARPVRDASLQALRPLLREVADRCREQPELTAELVDGRGALLCEYEPALRDLDAQPLPAVTQGTAHTRLLSCLRDTLVALARHKPLLLLFDDVQWMDRLSLEVIGSLSPELLAQTRLLIIGAHRAEHAPPQLSAAAQASHWPLGRLASDAIIGIVCDMLAVDRLPPQLGETVVARAAGSPLYAAEYLRLAIANGWLVRAGVTGWTFAPPARLESDGSTPVPRTLEEVIAQRFLTLSDGARDVAVVASVLGRSFSIVELLACAEPRERVLLGVDELIEARVLEGVGTELLRFVHDNAVRKGADMLPRRALGF